MTPIECPHCACDWFYCHERVQITDDPEGTEPDIAALQTVYRCLDCDAVVREGPVL